RRHLAGVRSAPAWHHRTQPPMSVPSPKERTYGVWSGSASVTGGDRRLRRQWQPWRAVARQAAWPARGQEAPPGSGEVARHDEYAAPGPTGGDGRRGPAGRRLAPDGFPGVEQPPAGTAGHAVAGTAGGRPVGLPV